MLTRLVSRQQRETEEMSCPDWLQAFLQAQETARREEMTALRELIAGMAPQQPFADANSEPPAATPSSDGIKPKLPSPNRPPVLNIDTTFSNFKAWRETWEDYAMLQNHEKLPLAIQKADFRSCLSDDMKQHLKCAIDIAMDDENISLKDILDKIQAHLRLKRNVAIDKVAFETLRQEEEQSFDEFYVSLRKLASEADLCSQCVDTRLVTKIMAGIHSQEIRQKLLALSPFPDLKTVVNLCRSHETSLKDSETLNEGGKIDRINQKASEDKEPTQNCYKCGGNQHKDQEYCPTTGSKCLDSGK